MRSTQPLEKDSSVIATLRQLDARFGEGALYAIDHSDGDLCAINVSREQNSVRQVYICTFGRTPARYDVELELPAPVGSDFPYVSGGWHYDIDFETLARLVAEHLGLRGPGGSDINAAAV